MVMTVRMGVVMRMSMSVTVVAVAVIGHMAAVGTAFGLKGQVRFDDGHVHAAQHVGQHMVGLDLEVVGLQLNGHMAVAQVVGGTHEVKRCAVLGAGRDLEQFLRCRNGADSRRRNHRRPHPPAWGRLP